MPLWEERKLFDRTELSIWKVDEPEEFFFERLQLADVEQQELERLRGRRRLEWLASRYLVHDLLSGESEWARIPLVKDEHGKPHLHGTPLHLSFSHSHEWAAVIVAEVPVGIDIQVFVPKIGRLAPKFMRQEESASLQPDTHLEHLHFYWCAKEALYKSYGRRELEWREHILVEPFDYQEITTSKGQVCKDGFCEESKLFFEKHQAFFLTYSVSSSVMHLAV